MNAAMLIIGLIFAVVGLAVASMLKGCFLLKSKATPKGVAFIAFGLAVLTILILGPSTLHQWRHGRNPIDIRIIRIKIGMTKDEVVKLLGKPCEVHNSLIGPRWYYDTDSIGYGWFSVSFGEDGKANGMGGD